MPREPEGNVPGNNEENIQNNEPVIEPVDAANEANNEPEIVQPGGGDVPVIDPALVNIDGVQPHEPGYVPPVPPEDVPQEEMENLNINAELEAQNRQEAQNEVREEQNPENVLQGGEAGRTYLQYVGKLKKERFTDTTVSHLIASSILMQRDPEAVMDWATTVDLANKIQAQPAFERLMADPKTKGLKEAGNGLALIEMLAAKENERKAEMNKYARPADMAYEDSLFLTEAKVRLQDKEGVLGAGKKAVGRKSKYFRQMIKQIEHAESLAQKGLALSGDDTRKLIDAVKKYNDGGSKVPGGTKKAAGVNEAMCILKRYMPEGEFNLYCSRINMRHNKKLDPESFTERRLYGQDLSVAEMKRQCRLNLQKEFTLENCAALAACATTKPKHGLIDADAYEREKAKLLQEGSAFRVAMKSEDAQKKLWNTLQNGGTANEVIEDINKQAMEKLGKRAQWHFNRSRGALLSGRTNTYFAGEHLANLMALNQLQLSAGMGEQVTNRSFAERAQAIQEDPVFKRMANRYASDPEYRNHINSKLREDGTGDTLVEEFGRVQRSMNRRRGQAQQEQQQPVIVG